MHFSPNSLRKFQNYSQVDFCFKINKKSEEPCETEEKTEKEEVLLFNFILL